MSERDFVNITIYGVPGSLVKEFMEKVVKPSYPGGISPAIVALMRDVIEEEKYADVLAKFPWKKDEKLIDEAWHLHTSKRHYENYSIFTLGEIIGKSDCPIVVRFRHEYPDAILVNIENNEAINVEFEEVSSNFRKDGHDPAKCDLIVCNEHDWKEKYPNEKCPLPVYELRGNEFRGKYCPKEEQKQKGKGETSHEGTA